VVPALAFAQQATAPGQQTGPAVDRYVVGPAVPEPTEGSSMLPLTLEQAMEMALEKNLDLKVARMNPQGVDLNYGAYRHRFAGCEA
jgi:hypothetical protein